MSKCKKTGTRLITIITIVLIALAILLDILSCIMFQKTSNIHLLLRVLSRGILGVLVVYHSILYLFTSKKYFLTKTASQKQRIFGGILLGIVGIGMIITAFLGYGMNGDPRYIWWN